MKLTIFCSKHHRRNIGEEILARLEYIMSATDDLTTAVSALDTTVTNGLTEIERLVELVLSAPDAAAVRAATEGITAETARIRDAVAASQTSVPPAPTP